MASTFPAVLSSMTLQNSRQLLLDRDDAIRSSHSGTVFPTLDLVKGMWCLREDLNHIYILETLVPLSWQLVLDLNKTPLNQEAADARYVNVTGDEMSGSLTTLSGAMFGAKDAGGVLRWKWGGGTNRFQIERWSAAGAYVDTPFYVDDTGAVFVEGVRVQTRLTFTPYPNTGGQLSGSMQANGPFVSASDAAAQIIAATPNGTGSSDTQIAAVGLLIPNVFGTKLKLRGDGIVGIGGWSAAAWRWYTNTTNGDMVAAGNVVAYSDKRLKKGIAKISGALSLIEKMRGVSFTRKDTGERQIGVVAQEVEELVPELVIQPPAKSKDGPRYKGVAYGNFAALFIEAIKELSASIQSLNERVDRMERRL